MTRRKSEDNFLEALYEILLIVPAWVGPALAAAFYLGLRFAWPSLFSDDTEQPWGAFAGIGPGIAPYVGVGVAVLWVVAEGHKFLRRRLLDKQSGLDNIRDLSWQEFERLVGEAYRRQGFVVKETGSSGGDGGVDLVLNRGTETVLVQCKQWRKRKVGVKPVRELLGVMTSEAATQAVLVTCGSFTKEAEAFAAGKPLKLVEGPELWDLIRSVKTSGASTTELKSQLGTDSADTPLCPECGSPMVLRTAKRGPKAGSQFWGCSGYPRCRGSRDQGA